MTDVGTGEKPLRLMKRAPARPRAWCRARRTILNRERRIGCQISGRRAANAEIDRVLCPISFPIAVAESRRNGEGGGGRPDNIAPTRLDREACGGQNHVYSRVAHFGGILSRASEHCTWSYKERCPKSEDSPPQTMFARRMARGCRSISGSGGRPRRYRRRRRRRRRR